MYHIYCRSGCTVAVQRHPTLPSSRRATLLSSTWSQHETKGFLIAGMLAHWNAGSAHLVNKMHEIEQVVSDCHPHLLGISEANLKRNHQLEDVQLPEYDLLLSKTIDNEQLQISRVVCYKHQSLVGKVREDLMSDQFSSIWLEIGLPGKKKILPVNCTDNGDTWANQKGAKTQIPCRSR